MRRKKILATIHDLRRALPIWDFRCDGPCTISFSPKISTNPLWENVVRRGSKLAAIEAAYEAACAFQGMEKA